MPARCGARNRSPPTEFDRPARNGHLYTNRTLLQGIDGVPLSAQEQGEYGMRLDEKQPRPPSPKKKSNTASLRMTGTGHGPTEIDLIQADSDPHRTPARRKP